MIKFLSSTNLVISKYNHLQFIYITTSSLTDKVNNKFLVPLLIPSLPPPYVCLFMDKIETAFLETQELQPLVWFRYIDNFFFIWTLGEKELQTFLHSLNEFHTDIKFTYE